MTRLVFVVAFLFAACSTDDAPSETASDDPLGDRIRAEWRKHLVAAAAGPGDDVVLTDDTPRLDLPDEPGPGTMSAYVPSASYRLPVDRLSGIDIAVDGADIEVRFRYGATEVAIKDASGTADAALAALMGVGADLGATTWAQAESAVREWAATRNVEALDARLEGFERNRRRWDLRYSKRYSDKMFDLSRAALRARIDAEEAELSDLYRNCRLVLVKRRLVAAVAGPAASPVRAIAAGPVVGLIRESEGRTDVSWEGPDGMVIRVRVQGELTPVDRLNLLGSYRPFARGRGAPGRLDRAVSSAPPLQATVAALSAVLLEPTPVRATAFVAALKRLPGTTPATRERNAGALARWLHMEKKEATDLAAAAR